MGDPAAAAVRSPTRHPHVLLVSFPGQGHLNPLLRFAKRLASKGLLVTFSSTTFIGNLISSSSNPASLPSTTPESVGKGLLRFEFFSDGWELDDPRRFDIDCDDFLPQLKSAGYPAVKNIISRHAEGGEPISCIINNPFLPWVLDLAQELEIPSAVLWVQSCVVFSTYYHFYHSLAEFPSLDTPDAAVRLPGLPELKPDELPTFVLPSNPYKTVAEIVFAQFENMHKATWVFANSFEELEREAIRGVCDRQRIIPVGPLVDGADSDGVKSDMRRAADCMDWLGLHRPNSVVYVSVGSVVRLTKEEVVEMANGLLNCGQPFLWVVRDEFRDFLPENFVDDAKENGMVVSWSPQERVLAHPSVGCFLTHCGWNSTLEALAAGVPVVAYPQWGDQVPGAKFLVDVYGVGVKLKEPARREDVVKCVEEVMRSETMKETAAEWKKKAAAAVADGGSSDRNVQAFVDEIVTRSFLVHQNSKAVTNVNS